MSCDTALGLCANVIQYQSLQLLIAKEIGIEAGDLIWTIHNAHIYDRHLEALVKQVNSETIKDVGKIHLNNKSLNEFKPDDIVIEYNHNGKIMVYEIAI